MIVNLLFHLNLGFFIVDLNTITVNLSVSTKRLKFLRKTASFLSEQNKFPTLVVVSIIKFTSFPIF